MAAPQLSLKGRALRLLSSREHSRLELTEKLQSFEQEPGQLARVLDELQAKGFIDEQRVVDSVLHRRANKLGAARVRQELQAKGLPPEAVQAATVQLQLTELERARAIWQKKFSAAPNTPEARAKQMRFLAARGFGGDVVRRVVSSGNDNSFAEEGYE